MPFARRWPPNYPCPHTLRKRALELERLDLNDVVTEVIHLVTSDADHRQVVIDVEPANRPLVVEGDRVHLQQVLLNLILNGMEAMAETPVASRRLSVRTRSTDGGVEVLVADTGHGIAPDRLPRLFDSFFTTKREGMGLGLSIVRSIIEAHRGRIGAENNAGPGATFRIRIPVAAVDTVSSGVTEIDRGAAVP